MTRSLRYRKRSPACLLILKGSREPRRKEKPRGSAVRRTVNEKNSEEDRPVLREETIRQILEEFLA